jgi:hypothetical protein
MRDRTNAAEALRAEPVRDADRGGLAIRVPTAAERLKLFDERRKPLRVGRFANDDPEGVASEVAEVERPPEAADAVDFGVVDLRKWRRGPVDGEQLRGLCPLVLGACPADPLAADSEAVG